MAPLGKAPFPPLGALAHMATPRHTGTDPIANGGRSLSKADGARALLLVDIGNDYHVNDHD